VVRASEQKPTSKPRRNAKNLVGNKQENTDTGVTR
jgi:hypothetical protein